MTLSDLESVEDDVVDADNDAFESVSDVREDDDLGRSAEMITQTNELQLVSSTENEEVTVVAPAKDVIDLREETREPKSDSSPGISPLGDMDEPMTLSKASDDDDDELTVLRGPREDRSRVPSIPPPVSQLPGSTGPNAKQVAPPQMRSRAAPPPTSRPSVRPPSVPPPPPNSLRESVRAAGAARRLPAGSSSRPPPTKAMPTVPPAPVTFAAAHAPPASRRDTVPPTMDPRGRTSSIAPFANSVIAPRLGSSRAPWAVAAVALLALGLVGAYTLTRPTTGELLVTSEGADDAVAVFVDGEKECDRTPCHVPDLAEGSHLVRTESGDTASTAQRAVVVAAGATNTHHVTLGRSADAAAALTVIAEGPGLRVTVDGRDLGAPPLSLEDMDPGTHVVRVASSEGYEPYEETITLRKGETRSLGPIQLKALQGSGPPQSTQASSRESANSSSDPSSTRSRTRSTKSAPRSTRAASRRRSASSSSSGAKGILSINSVPRSNVIVDGHPLGSTPIAGVRVKPGTHTVVFVHPDKGRKVVNAVVQGGGKATAMVRF